MVARFEYALIAWSTMEGITAEQEWDRWGGIKQWEWLPPHQDMRHRCDDEVLYLGGYAPRKYQMVKHANMEHKPSWRLWLGEHYFSFMSMVSCEKYHSKLVLGAFEGTQRF